MLEFKYIRRELFSTLSSFLLTRLYELYELVIAVIIIIIFFLLAWSSKLICSIGLLVLKTATVIRDI